MKSDVEVNDWYVYLIRCMSGILYTGITTDLERRLREHHGKKGKGAKALRGKGPLQMVWHTQVGNRSEASKLEYKIKQMSKLDKEKLVAEFS